MNLKGGLKYLQIYTFCYFRQSSNDSVNKFLFKCLCAYPSCCIFETEEAKNNCYNFVTTSSGWICHNI